MGKLIEMRDWRSDLKRKEKELGIHREPPSHSLLEAARHAARCTEEAIRLGVATGFKSADEFTWVANYYKRKSFPTDAEKALVELYKATKRLAGLCRMEGYSTDEIIDIALPETPE